MKLVLGLSVVALLVCHGYSVPLLSGLMKTAQGGGVVPGAPLAQAMGTVEGITGGKKDAVNGAMASVPTATSAFNAAPIPIPNVPATAGAGGSGEGDDAASLSGLMEGVEKAVDAVMGLMGTTTTTTTAPSIRQLINPV